MKFLVLALPFLAFPAAVWAGDDEVCLPTRMSLDDERRERQQDVETERQRPDDTSRLTPMEFIYRHSNFEVGAMYTDFDGSLSLKSHLGYYFRYGVDLTPHITAHMTYRYNAFGNGPRSAVPQEDIVVQALLFGASYHQPLMRDFALVGGLAIGPTWWNSTVSQNEIGFTVSFEMAATARLWELLHLKAGLVVDGTNTTFHSASGMSVNLSWLFGLEIGL